MNKELFELDKLFKSNKFDEVILMAKKLIKKGKNLPAYYNLLGISLDNTGKSYKAEKIFLDAIKENSKEISFYSNLAKILIKQDKLEEAENILNEALKINSDDPFSLFEFGKLKRLQKNLFKALEYFKKVYKINPKFPNALFLVGKTYLEISQDSDDQIYKDLSKKNLLESSRLFPDNVDADFLLSEVYDYQKEKKHQKIMLNKVENINFSNRRQKSVLLFSIAKSFEDQKKYDQASEFLKIANNEMNSSIEKKIILKYSKRFENLKFLFDKIINIKYLNDVNLCKKKIICIVGMPRSGTTLLHQLLASKEETEGIGESAVIPSFFENNIFSKEFFDKINKKNKLNIDYLVKISQLLGVEFNNIQTSEKNIIIDKNPSNFFWIGFIKLLFPNSKIIHIKRNLKDVGLSVYKNIFGVDEMNWSYDPNNIIEYIKIYIKTINYWKNKYNNFICEVDYENLINNKIEETKKLFSFCDLDWTEEIFNFYKTAKTIRTASLYQVKRPIYKSSVNISDKYSNYLNFLNDLNNLQINQSKI
tara:strand:+ start:3826 stop:5427 length:1602 start_codon:yes stop_codon:yes gene_type:complete